MFRFIKNVCALVGFLTLALVALFFARNWVFKHATQFLIHYYSPFAIEWGEVNTAPSFPPQIQIMNSYLKNPSDFSQPVGMKISRFEIQFNPTSGLLNSWQLDRCLIEIELLNIVRRANRDDNIDRLGDMANHYRDPSKQPIEFSIKEATLILKQIAFIEPHASEAPTTTKLDLQAKATQVTSLSKLYDMLLKLISEIARPSEKTT